MADLLTGTDFLILGGELIPGRVVLTGAGDPRDWEKRKGQGTTGATLVYNGTDLSQFSAKVAIWDKPGTGDWLIWEEVAKRVLVDAKGTGKALSIVHWQLTVPPLKITSVVILDVTQWEYSEGEDLWTCEIKLEVYRAPTPALGKPNGTKGGTGGSATSSTKQAQPAAKDAADEEIQRLLKQFQDELAK